MAQQNLYPRVEINTIAKRHSSVRPAAEDTTSILAMCITEKGPAKGITVVHSLAEFIEIFGELDYKLNGQNALNIYNWLSNGGTAYVKRFTSDAHDDIVDFKNSNDNNGVTLFRSKYAGEYYEHLEITILKVTDDVDPRYTITVSYNNGKMSVTVEKFYRILKSRLSDVLADSEYINYLKDNAETALPTQSGSSSVFLYYPDSDVTSVTETSLEEKIRAYFLEEDGSSEHIKIAEKDLENKLLAPFELVIGAGYTEETDSALIEFFTTIRPDVVLILDDYVIKNNLEVPEPKGYYAVNNIADAQNTHIACFGQYFKIYDNIFTDRNIYVSPTYFLSGLIPYNDALYGIQNPVAGLRRGVLSGALEIHDNLTVSEKNTYFKNRVNYVEKTTREYAIMGNRTKDGSTEDNYTALSFLNNVRTLERMKKEIERMARSYLFEFNDAYTLSQLSNILNKYITEWILNRTLNLGVVTVEKDQYSDEQINIGLNIRFNGTVEVIHVDIVIE